MHVRMALLPGLRRHPQYVALQGVAMFGTLMGALYGLRVAAMEPEVTWRHHTNLEPWNAYANKQYKLWSAGRDYSEGCPAPKY